MTNEMKRLAVLALTMGLAACGGGSSGDNNVVYDQTITIAEGQQLSVILPAGSYRADITSNNRGVVVSWVGGACATSTEVKAYSGTCNLSIKGQLLVLNPTVLGLGGDEVATVLVTKI